MQSLGGLLLLVLVFAGLGVIYLADRAAKRAFWRREYRAFRRDSGRAE